MFAYCLADFFNLDLWPTGREPVYSDVRDGIELLVGEVMTAVPLANEVTVRLYGGWHGDVPDSRSAVREMTLRAILGMTKRRGRSRLRMELAEAPIWDRSLTLLRTVRVSRLANVPGKVEQSPLCGDPRHCTIMGLRSWLGGKCPTDGCPVKLSQVLWRHQQKMVDSLLTADAVTIARDGLVDAVLLASDDDDMLPALFALTRTTLSVVHMVRNASLTAYYEANLECRGVRIYRW